MYINYPTNGVKPTNPLANGTGATEVRTAPANFVPGTTNTPLDGPNTRTISNVVVQGNGDLPGPPFSAYMFGLGQFIDHDLGLSFGDGVNHIDIIVPPDDPTFVPGTPITLTRAIVDPTTGTQINTVTGWLDASQVYGSDVVTASGLRGPNGRLLTSPENNLPVVKGAVMAGDIRAGENSDLTSVHVLFVREHNLWADRFAASHPDWTDDQVFNAARAVTTAEFQNIVYNEYLPVLLGKTALGAYRGFDASVDPRISQEFPGAIFRFGHTLVSPTIQAIDNNGLVTSDKTFDSTFDDTPADFLAVGADGVLRNLADKFAQKFDAHIVESLRTFLFDPPVGQDLAAVNLQRGRDLGLPTLNGERIALGLTPYQSISEITTDASVIADLTAVYGGDVNKVELWIGGISEKAAPGAVVGSTFQTAIARQFTNLRNGDSLYFENQPFSPEMMAQIKTTTFSDIILRNTDTNAIQDDVFFAAARHASNVVPTNPDMSQLVIGVDTANAALTGGMHNDTLVAGRGVGQTLNGGPGADTFQFLYTGVARNATVIDFTPGIDQLDFEATVDRGLTFDDLFITANATGSVVALGTDVVNLFGVSPDQIRATDIVFDRHAIGASSNI